MAKLEEICRAEGVQIRDDEVGGGDGGGSRCLLRILAVAQGDLRRAITLLQSVHCLAMAAGQPITPELIDRVSGGLPDPTAIDAIYRAALHSQSQPSEILTLINDGIVRRGISASLILSHLQGSLMADPLLPNNCKARAALTIAHTDHALHEGADEQLQLESLFLSLRTIHNNNQHEHQIIF